MEVSSNYKPNQHTVKHNITKPKTTTNNIKEPQANIKGKQKSLKTRHSSRK